LESLRDQVRDAVCSLDVHLMIERPEHQVDAFAAAGADSIAIHWEATPNVHYALKAVRDAGCNAGLAINPATAPDAVMAAVEAFDHVLCMTVNPGWGGQPYIESSTDKVRRLRELLPDDMPIEVDGGIDPQTGAACTEAGATLFVAGSSIFGQEDPAGAYTEIVEATGAV
jgi:ribulose-phosphate 3-epimerase